MANTSEVSLSLSHELIILEGLRLPARVLTPSTCFHPLPLSLCHMPRASRVPPTGCSCQGKSGHTDRHPRNTCSPTTLGSQGGLLFFCLPAEGSKDATAPLLLPSIAFQASLQGLLPTISAGACFLLGRQDHELASTAPTLQASPPRLQPPPVLPPVQRQSFRLTMASSQASAAFSSVMPPSLFTPVHLTCSPQLTSTHSREVQFGFPLLRSTGVAVTRGTQGLPNGHIQCALFRPYDPGILLARD